MIESTLIEKLEDLRLYLAEAGQSQDSQTVNEAIKTIESLQRDKISLREEFKAIYGRVMRDTYDE